MNMFQTRLGLNIHMGIEFSKYSTNAQPATVREWKKYKYCFPELTV
jgi:hypothetical protein